MNRPCRTLIALCAVLLLPATSFAAPPDVERLTRSVNLAELISWVVVAAGSEYESPVGVALPAVSGALIAAPHLFLVSSLNRDRGEAVRLWRTLSAFADASAAMLCFGFGGYVYAGGSTVGTRLERSDGAWIASLAAPLLIAAFLDLIPYQVEP